MVDINSALCPGSLIGAVCHYPTPLNQRLHATKVGCRTVTIPLQKGNIAEALLERTALEKVDLVAFGGFAYKSNRAPVLSPLTRELLIKAPVPLLISH